MLILASQSPRRQALLHALGLSFAVRPVDIDESLTPGDSPEMTVWRLACEKAAAAHTRGDAKDGSFLLAADTIVVLDGRILNKPKDRVEAASMIRTLAGRTHAVYTAVCAMDKAGSRLVELVKTAVTFRPLAESEIEAYVATGEGLDKAGAYAVQGIGATLIELIDGSYTNVIGLPIRETLDLLKRLEGMNS